MDTLNDIQSAAMSVLQANQADASLVALITSSFGFAKSEVEQSHELSFCKSLLKVNMRSGTTYSAKGGFQVKLRVNLHLSLGEVDRGIIIDTYDVFANKVGLKVADQTIDINTNATINFTFEEALQGEFLVTNRQFDVQGIHEFNGGDNPGEAWVECDMWFQYTDTIRRVKLAYEKCEGGRFRDVLVGTYEGFAGQAFKHTALGTGQGTGRKQIVAVNALDFQVVSGGDFDGFMVVVLEVGAYTGWRGLMFIAMAKEFIFWNAVMKGNYRTGTFLPRQEGSIDPPTAEKQSALERLISDDAWLDQQQVPFFD